MRIEKITVKNLFRTFDHVIPLNLDDRITIIHGPNGFGKSTLLKMMEGVLKSGYSEIRAIPFDEFSLFFQGGAFIKIIKGTPEEDSLQLVYSLGADERTVELDSEFNLEELGFPLEVIEDLADLIPELDQVGPQAWVHTLTGKALDLRAVLERYKDRLPDYGNINLQPKELLDLVSSVNVRMIETQRLSSQLRRRRVRLRPAYNIVSATRRAVSAYSEELSEAIEATLTEYATLSQSLDRTFPFRLIEHSSQSELTKDDIDQALGELEKKRSQLRDVGLLEREEDVSMLEEIDETTMNVLSVYIEDTRTKLGIFDEMAAKIELLRNIVNSRFRYKQMSVSKEEGFIFTTADGKILDPTSLSSGEQHTLVVLYELLFKVEPNSIILIDEPELSLHVEWQVNFLAELQKITELASLDVLMATHSPDIINDRWDLTVELQGPTK